MDGPRRHDQSRAPVRTMGGGRLSHLADFRRSVLGRQDGGEHRHLRRPVREVGAGSGGCPGHRIRDRGSRCRRGDDRHLLVVRCSCRRHQRGQRAREPASGSQSGGQRDGVADGSRQAGGSRGGLGPPLPFCAGLLPGPGSKSAQNGLGPTQYLASSWARSTIDSGVG